MCGFIILDIVYGQVLMDLLLKFFYFLWKRFLNWTRENQLWKWFQLTNCLPAAFLSCCLVINKQLLIRGMLVWEIFECLFKWSLEKIFLCFLMIVEIVLKYKINCSLESSNISLWNPFVSCGFKNATVILRNQCGLIKSTQRTAQNPTVFVDTRKSNV